MANTVSGGDRPRAEPYDLPGVHGDASLDNWDIYELQYQFDPNQHLRQFLEENAEEFERTFPQWTVNHIPYMAQFPNNVDALSLQQGQAVQRGPRTELAANDQHPPLGIGYTQSSFNNFDDSSQLSDPPEELVDPIDHTKGAYDPAEEGQFGPIEDDSEYKDSTTPAPTSGSRTASKKKSKRNRRAVGTLARKVPEGAFRMLDDQVKSRMKPQQDVRVEHDLKSKAPPKNLDLTFLNFPVSIEELLKILSQSIVSSRRVAYRVYKAGWRSTQVGKYINIARRLRKGHEMDANGVRGWMKKGLAHYEPNAEFEEGVQAPITMYSLESCDVKTNKSDGAIECRHPIDYFVSDLACGLHDSDLPCGPAGEWTLTKVIKAIKTNPNTKEHKALKMSGIRAYAEKHDLLVAHPPSYRGQPNHPDLALLEEYLWEHPWDPVANKEAQQEARVEELRRTLKRPATVDSGSGNAAGVANLQSGGPAVFAPSSSTPVLRKRKADQEPEEEDEPEQDNKRRKIGISGRAVVEPSSSTRVLRKRKTGKE